MKKSLLFSLSLGVAIFATAQTQRNYGGPVKVEKTFKANRVAEKTLYSNQGPVKPTNNTVKSINSVSKVDIGSSANVYTALVEASHCLSANPATGLINYIHRGGGTITGGSSSDIVSAYSTDGGATWERLIVNPANGNANRYPSGAIYNPQGNTDPNNAYILSAGPITVSTQWTKNYFTSIKLDSTNADVQIIDNETSPALHDYMMRYGMEASSNGLVHVYSSDYEISTNPTTDVDYVSAYNGIYMRNGQFNPNTNKFDWSLAVTPVAFFKGGKDNELFYNSDNSAWSEDGMTGYVYFLGLDTGLTTYSYQPIIYKTIDGGNTWNKEARFDFAQLQVVMDSVWPEDPEDPATVRPYFTGLGDAVVDNNGYLHLVSQVMGHYYSHIDSLGYTYSNEPKHLFHFWQTANGWDGKYITPVKAKYVSSTTSGYGTGAEALGWGSRLQCSRTADGTKIFAVWGDTDPGTSAENNFPDIFAWGCDLTTGLDAPAKNITAGTAYEADNYFHYVGTRTMVNGNEYTIPVTTILRGSTPLDPVTHQYLSGVTFSDSEFVGINEVKNNNFNVSQNYPNPADGTTSIDINLSKSANVSLVVTNIMGQVVDQMNFGKVNSGKTVATINTASLNSGVYFYTVNVDNSSYTNKMIVK